MARPAKAKKVNYDVVSRKEDPAMYDLLDGTLAAHHEELIEAKARIALAWRKGLKPDADRKLTLGKCQRINDLHRQMMPFDFCIILNREAWQDFSDDQRRALLHHECCHAGVTKNRDGTIKKDENGRTVFRLRRHDIEEFRSVVSHYGLYKQDLADFAEECAAKRETPLFANVPEPNGNGHAAEEGAGEAGEAESKPARRRKKVG